MNYRILLREEDEGGYTVIVPSLPGCVTYGETKEEAVRMAKEAIELYLETI
jgi:antitoxin HicB